MRAEPADIEAYIESLLPWLQKSNNTSSFVRIGNSIEI